MDNKFSITLKNTTKLVESILEESTMARDSDDVLYCRVIQLFSYANDINLAKEATPVWFFHDRASLGFPSYETVSRARRKIQSQRPELKSSLKASVDKSEKEQAFKAYATREV